MTVTSVTTGTGTRSDYFSFGEWDGRSVLVQEFLWDEQGPCPGHALAPMTHFGEVVPGTLYCPYCCGVATFEDEAA